MARIRTIKPEFWTSEQVMTCSRDARLLFIGMWNFADDAGIQPASPVRLKAQVFPGDDISTNALRTLVEELVNARLIAEYEVDGKPYWIITGWAHQKIDKPQPSKHPKPPAPPRSPSPEPETPQETAKVDQKIDDPSPTDPGALSDNSTNDRRMLSDQSSTEGKGKEKDREEEEDSDREPYGSLVADATGGPSPGDLAAEMAAIWTNICGDILPKPNRLKPPRRKKLLLRLKDTFGGSLEQWRAYCQRIRAASVLTGQSKSGWRASIDWALEPMNVAKVLEGNYDRGRSNGAAGLGAVRPTEILKEMFDGDG